MNGYVVTVNGRRVDEMSARERAAMRRRDKARLAEMLATGAVPRVVTDDTFRATLDVCNGKQFEGDPHVGDFYRERAEAAGVSTTGKAYMHGLAAFPGDPRAWVSTRGEVRRVVEERGWGCEGTVNVKARTDVAPVQGPAVAEDIVRREVADEMAKDPGQKVEDVREKVVAKRKPHWSK